MDATEFAPWQEAPRGAGADIGLLRLNGVEQLRTFVDGTSPTPPVARLTGRRIVAAEVGRVVYRLPVTDWLVGPRGTLHPGVIAFLADAPLLAAVQTTLSPGTICTTAEVSTTFLGTALSGDELTVEGRVIHAHGATGLAEAFVTRGDGRLVGHATSRVYVFPPIPQDDGPLDLRRAEVDDDSDDPYRRAAPAWWAPPDGSERSGLALLRSQLDEGAPPPPIDRLTGISLLDAEEGKVSFALPTHAWTANEFGTVYGGMIALLAASAGSAAVQSIAHAGTAFRALDMKLNIVRPVNVGSGDLLATGSVVHRGRTLAIATTDVVNDRGKRVAVATGTTMLGSAAEAEALEQDGADYA